MRNAENSGVFARKEETVVTVVGVRFKRVGKIYYFTPGDLELNIDDYVIVETTRGIEFGMVAMRNKEIDDDEVVAPLKSVVRKATEEDIRINEENHRKEQEAIEVCRQKIAEHKLNMKLVDAEYTFDNNKVLFYFTADGRIDFRDLVKNLASVFKTRIELRQIGVRDEAKMMGGLGVCGRPLCCNTYLGDFHPVSIKMAKEQGLSLNPTKISGTCGRLMCCLKYEQEVYEDLLARVPRVGSIVETDRGQGVIMEVNMLKEELKVKLDMGNETDLCIYKPEDVKVIKRASAEEAVPSEIEKLKQLEDN